MHDSDYNDEFSGFSGGKDLDVPGWHRGIIDRVITRDEKTGEPFQNDKGKRHWRLRLQVEGGPNDGKSILDFLHLHAGWRLLQYMAVVGRDEEPEDDKLAASPAWFVGAPLVFHVGFRQGQDRLNVTADPDQTRIPSVLSLTEAKRLIDEGTIYVENFDVVKGDEKDGDGNDNDLEF